MNSKIRFVHAADIHLGSMVNFSGQLPEEVEVDFEDATMNAFTNICDIAIDYKVNFMILSGDVFEQNSRSIKVDDFFYQQSKRLQNEGIDIYMIAGNHDPAGSRRELLKLPQNVKLFDSEKVETFSVLDNKGKLIARILGQSYRGFSESRKMYNFYTVPDSSVWNIGLLHTQLDPSNNNYVPCSLNDLQSKEDIHYWALGHVHKARIFRKNEQVTAYPGIPQGRDSGETGVGGCLLVDMIPGQETQVNFIPVSSIIWKSIPVSIEIENEPKNINDLVYLIKKKAEKILEESPEIKINVPIIKKRWLDLFKGYIIQWVLTGRGEIHDLLQEQNEDIEEFISERLNQEFGFRTPFIWTDSIVDRTGKSLPGLDTLGGEIYQEIRNIVTGCLSDPGLRSELKNELGMIWQDKFDHEKIDEDKFQIEEKILDTFINKGTDLIIEGLLEGREDL